MNAVDINALVRAAAHTIGGEYRTSHAGVPHIILTVGNIKMSLVYVARANKWKLFYPWPSEEQKRVYFRDLVTVAKWLDKEGREIGGLAQKSLDD